MLIELDSFDQTVTVVSNYLQFYIESLVPIKQLRVYPNTHPWMTNQVKNLLKEKQLLRETNKNLRTINATIRSEIQTAKRRYKDKVMSKATTNPKEMWRDVKLMMGCAESEANYRNAVADDLNGFFCRFERPKQA
ncbi:hypothetical protein HOLleu_28386 [Holothuria leucospilota]|uniref:Uncharacterized protein n=1 Tax=Holothuria leucospilota TaxID=206669 RepID=A0A9Q1BMB2_HOLLE|nr:hypothetical protein HOLleu_28386 [Holothuria leucospilota]